MSSEKKPRVFLSPPHLGGAERRHVEEAFASNYIAPLGPKVNAFEAAFAEYTGIPYCCALVSGTAATHLALRHLITSKTTRPPDHGTMDRPWPHGQWPRAAAAPDSSAPRPPPSSSGPQLSGFSPQPSPPPQLSGFTPQPSPPPQLSGFSPQPSSRGSARAPLVLASTLTFIGSVSPATFEDCDITFIDSAPGSWNLDPALLEQELADCAARGRLPVAVIPTDLYGDCCELPRIVAICDRYGVPVICDSAEAMGARYRSQKSEVGSQKSEGGVAHESHEFTRREGSTGGFGVAGEGSRAVNPAGIAVGSDRQRSGDDGCGTGVPSAASTEPSPVGRGESRFPTGGPGAGPRSASDPSSDLRPPSSDLLPPASDPRPSTPDPSLWRHAGFDAWAAVYSFNGNKIMTSSGGGMLASHDKELIEHARKLATQARDPFPYYEHTEIGYNYRMSNIVAAVGLGQLEILDARVARKSAIRRIYQEELAGVAGIRFMPIGEGQRPNGWLTVILIDETAFGASPETVRLALEAENIEARPVWKPMHAQPVFLPDGAYGSRHEVRVVGGAQSEALFRQGLCLPSGTAMDDDQIRSIAAAIRRQKG